MPELSSFYFRFLLWSASFIFSLTASAQHNKLDIVAQPFVDDGTVDKTYSSNLYELTLKELLDVRKFNVVNKNPEFWKAIEGELQTQDFNDPKSAINLGKMVSAKYLLTGRISSFSVERKTRITADNKIDYYFTAAIKSSLKVVSLESGLYKEAVFSEIISENTDREQAINDAIKKASSNLVTQLSLKFLVYARIANIAKQQVTLDKGRASGVKEYATFNILSNSNDTIGIVKVYAVFENECKAILLKGKADVIHVGNEVVESFNQLNIVAVEKTDKYKVYLAAGKNLNIKKGDIFVAKANKSTDLESRVVNEEIVTGRIYVTESKDNYSVGKIIAGRKNITSGLTLVQSKENSTVMNYYLKVGYKTPLSVSIKPSQASGIVPVQNKSGNYNIDTQYLNNYQSVQDIKIITMVVGSKNLVKDVHTSLSFDIYDMGPLKNWIAYVNTQHEYYFIPDRLSMLNGVAIGYGRLKQNIPGGVVEQVSNGKSDYISANSIFFNLSTGLKYEIGRFAVHANASYDFLRYNSWKYQLEANGTKSEAAPQAIIPYHDVNLTGLYFTAGLSYLYHK